MDAILDEMVRACTENPDVLPWIEGFAAADKTARGEEAEHDC